MLLVLFNKIRVHSYHTVLCWFLVSSLAPLIVHNDPVNDRCVGVTPSGSGSGFTADDRRLRLHSRQQVGVRVRVSTSRQESGLAPVARGRVRVTVRVMGHRQGAFRLPRRPCGCARNRKSLPNWSPLLLGQNRTITTQVFATCIIKLYDNELIFVVFYHTLTEIVRSVVLLLKTIPFATNSQ